MCERPCLYVVAHAGRHEELAQDSMLRAGIVCNSESDFGSAVAPQTLMPPDFRLSRALPSPTLG
jgi:hypothetical protein